MESKQVSPKEFFDLGVLDHLAELLNIESKKLEKFIAS